MATTIMISMRVNPDASFVFMQAFRVLIGIGAVVVAVLDRFAPPAADETAERSKSFAMGRHPLGPVGANVPQGQKARVACPHFREGHMG
jgi:hypothetical protein